MYKIKFKLNVLDFLLGFLQRLVNSHYPYPISTCNFMLVSSYRPGNCYSSQRSPFAFYRCLSEFPWFFRASKIGSYFCWGRYDMITRNKHITKYFVYCEHATHLLKNEIKPKRQNGIFSATKRIDSVVHKFWAKFNLNGSKTSWLFFFQRLFCHSCRLCKKVPYVK